jgi:hypothetical protein
MDSFTDTTDPKIEDLLIEGYRAMSPWQKLRCVDELTISVQLMALARIKSRYGNIPEREQRLRLASLWLDRQTMMHVFGWDPETHGY